MRFLSTTILKTGCLLGLMALAGANVLHAEERPQQPNIVILLADDISSDSFGRFALPPSPITDFRRNSLWIK